MTQAVTPPTALITGGTSGTRLATPFLLPQRGFAVLVTPPATRYITGATIDVDGAHPPKRALSTLI